MSILTGCPYKADAGNMGLDCILQCTFAFSGCWLSCFIDCLIYLLSMEHFLLLNFERTNVAGLSLKPHLLALKKSA